MDLYNKLLNIKGNNTEEVIKEAIGEVKELLKNLDYERMCLVYNSYLYEALLKRHLLVHIIDTNDLNISYQHRFLIVYDGNNYYLCDLTYNQFNNHDFPQLLEKGYMLCNTDTLNTYLNSISNIDMPLSIEQVFNSNNNSRK